ncbi:MAG TPA: hypothetical protein VGD47_10045, partial [Steroidobacteraceae bacterium]
TMSHNNSNGETAVGRFYPLFALAGAACLFSAAAVAQKGSSRRPIYVTSLMRTRSPRATIRSTFAVEQLKCHFTKAMELATAVLTVNTLASSFHEVLVQGSFDVHD